MPDRREGIARTKGFVAARIETSAGKAFSKAFIV